MEEGKLSFLNIPISGTDYLQNNSEEYLSAARRFRIIDL